MVLSALESGLFDYLCIWYRGSWAPLGRLGRVGPLVPLGALSFGSLVLGGHRSFSLLAPLGPWLLDPPPTKKN